MYIQQLTLSFLLALVLKAAIATPDRLSHPEANSHEKRIVCNQDNVLRALQANSANASPFCVTFAHIPIPTTTVPVPGVTPTVSGTLTNDACATKTTIPGGYTLSAPDPRGTVVSAALSGPGTNAFNCCSECYIQLKSGDCVAWAVVPGKTCIVIRSDFVYRQPRCSVNGRLNGTVITNLAKYPDALAGSGPCAATLNTVQG
ncbi:MAG: hypothetical protein Q9209_004951 [Squamulea sp. 1 TL-2023]